MKEKARHILCLAFLKSGEKNMEKILIYQVKETEAVKQLLAPMKIRLEEIKTTDLRQSIGDLAEGKRTCSQHRLPAAHHRRALWYSAV